MTSISLVIPTFGRPEQLAQCLRSVREQDRQFDEVIVVARADDSLTLQSLAGTSATIVTVAQPGVLAAMQAGAHSSTGDVIAFTDDDARLSPHWCAHVLELLALPENRDVGAVGGRDHIFDNDQPRSTTLTSRVGTLTWWGRLVGNHHRGLVNGRDVVVLKGVNVAYRRAALGLPTTLRGSGAQAHFEVSVGRYAREHGWRLRYYSDLIVQHFPAPRVGDDQRTLPSDQAVADSAFNLMRGLSAAHQTRRWLYVHLVGDRACPGVVRVAAAVLTRDRATVARRRPSWRATTEAWQLRHEPEIFTIFS